MTRSHKRGAPATEIECGCPDKCGKKFIPISIRNKFAPHCIHSKALTNRVGVLTLPVIIPVEAPKIVTIREHCWNMIGENSKTKHLPRMDKTILTAYLIAMHGEQADEAWEIKSRNIKLVALLD